MRITRVTAHNWRNFKNLDFPVENRVLVVGPNASGKSNLLDLFRFVGEISRPGGGLAAALASRGGLSKAKSLFARNNRHGLLVVQMALADDDDEWVYHLEVGAESRGRHRPQVAKEIVSRNGKILLQRPDRDDERDPERLTQTHLEQISANQSFRPIAEYFTKTNYFHLVPQVIRNPQGIGGAQNPAFGGNMIAQMNATAPKTRDAWLRRIQQALSSAVPGFESLRLEVDAAGQPHLIAGYRNWRSAPSQQNEADFSDGTLRLIGLLWTMVSAPANGGILLLEEPELSLNSSIVRKLPTLLALAQRDSTMQVVLSTHAPELLDDEGIDPEEVLVLRVTDDGTSAQTLSSIDDVADELAAEFPISEVVGGLISPGDLSGLLSAARKNKK